MKLSTRRHWLAVAVLILVAAGMACVSALEGSHEQSASIDKVQMWLAEIGADQTVQANFVAHEVNVEALLVLSRQQLEELGLTQLGRQARLMAKAKQEQEVQKRHGVASIRTNSYGDRTDKGGIQFCTKDEGSAEVGVKAVLSADGRFGIGVEGEPEAKLHVAGDAIFAAGHCDRIHAQYINASADVLVQERSVMGALEELRAADSAGERRLAEEVGAVNSSLTIQLSKSLKELQGEIVRKNEAEIAHLRAQLEVFTHAIANLTGEMSKKDEQIGNLSHRLQDEIGVRDQQIASLMRNLSEFQGKKNLFQGSVRMGENILNLWVSNLPVKKTWRSEQDEGIWSDGCSSQNDEGYYEHCGYAEGYLHLRTNLQCGGTPHGKYHFVFKGHILRTGPAFHCEAVGLVQNGIYFSSFPLLESSVCHHGNLLLHAYCGESSNDLVFRLEDPADNVNRWHSSNIVIDWVGHKGNPFTDLVMIKEAAHSPLGDIW